MPCSGKRARLLLSRGRAVIHRLVPFTIRLKDRFLEDCELQDLSLKLDPGSKTTGLAISRDTKTTDPTTGEVLKTTIAVLLLELVHHGQQISKKLQARAAYRRRRRSTNLRHREPRFNNRTKPVGWLPPSIQHRVDSTIHLVAKLLKSLPITHIYQELVRFDMQQMIHPEISGIQYQQGTLLGYEVREYLLEKYHRLCQYCQGQSGNHHLEVEHIHPRSKGGSNRLSNLTLACHICNQAKGNMDIRDYLSGNPVLLSKILSNATRPLKNAAAVNATRWALYNTLKTFGLPVSVGSGGLTKYNRSINSIPKDHCLDALCVGHIGLVSNWHLPILRIEAKGRGQYQRTKPDSYGFPRLKLSRTKRHYGFQTGDIVQAIITSGSKVGRYIGRVAVRATGSFNLKAVGRTIQGISHRYCRLIQRNDGYAYSIRRDYIGHQDQQYISILEYLVRGIGVYVTQTPLYQSLMRAHCHTANEHLVIQASMTRSILKQPDLIPGMDLKDLIALKRVVETRLINRLQSIVR
jgi:5-methylcytosine-specific restriction endonuclease McrA